MARIVITEFMGADHVAALAQSHEVVYEPDLWRDRARLAIEVANAEGVIIRNQTQFDAEIIDAANSLRVIGRLGVGLDNIDLAAARSRGITVCPATGANALAVAEYVVASAMVLLRRFAFTSERLVAGEWPRATLRGGLETAEKTLGVIGFGSIGRETARLAHAVGMKIIAFDPEIAPDAPSWQVARRVGFDELLISSDVITLHVPLIEQTRDMLGAQQFAKMKPGAILINTARGGTVDEAALAAALRSGHLGGAAIDVFSSEPITTSIGAYFRGLENVILTPHIAGGSRESDERVDGLTVRNVQSVLAK